MPEIEKEKAAREGRAEDERWHLRRDGSRFWANGMMMPLRAGDGRQIGFLKILRDRTESRAAEAALRDSEARLRFTLQAGRLGAWELDLRDGRLTASETFRANFGCDPDAPFSNEDLLAAVHEDDRRSMQDALARAVADRGDYDVEFRVIRPDGEVRWVQIRARPVYDEDGRALRMTGVSLDVTDRRQAEEELHRLNVMLESRVMQEVVERGKAEDALRQAQKMEAVGQLTGGVAHDFNNLLTIIRSSVDFLRRQDLAEDRRRRYLDAIATTVERAAKLTGQLLAFARRQALKPEVFDVAERLGELSDMMRTIVGTRIRIVTEAPGEPCAVEADLSQFETALVNMAVNARDAMDGEGVLTLKVIASAAPASVSGEASGEFVAISIKDTGTGIPPDRIAQIFEPFFTTKEVGKGTGLGLSQAYGFAKQSGGDLSVESEVGHGSVFTLYLPRVAAVAERGRAGISREPGAVPVGGGRRVLVVEDNVDVGAFATQLLQDLGYMTVWAESAAEALTLLEEDWVRFDVVFSDVVMPGMGGVEFGEEVRRRFPDLPVVLTSGYSEVLADEGRRGFELLHKPYAVEELSKMLRKVIRGRKQTG